MGIPVNDLRGYFTKKISIKKRNLIAIVGYFLPVCVCVCVCVCLFVFFFSDPMQIEPLSVPWLFTVIIKYHG